MHLHFPQGKFAERMREKLKYSLPSNFWH